MARFRINCLPRLHVVSSLNLHLRDDLVRLVFAVATALHKRVDDSLADGRRHVAGRSTEVEVAVLLPEVVVDDFRVLADAILDVDLVLLVARERAAEQGDDALAAGVVLLKLVSVGEVGAPVSRAEEQRHRSDGLTAQARHLAVLNHGTERRDASAEANHDGGKRVGVRDRDAGRVHLSRDQIRRRAFREPGQVAGAQTVALLSRRSDPVVFDDAEVDAVLVHLVRRRDRVKSRLYAGDMIQEVLQRQVRRREHLQQVGIRRRLLLQLLHLIFAVLAQQVLQLGAFASLLRRHLQRLVEPARRLAEDVEDFGEQLADGDHRREGLLAVLQVRQLENRVVVDAVLGAPFQHLLFVVVWVYSCTHVDHELTSVLRLPGNRPSLLG